MYSDMAVLLILLCSKRNRELQKLTKANSPQLSIHMTCFETRSVLTRVYLKRLVDRPWRRMRGICTAAAHALLVFRLIIENWCKDIQRLDNHA